MGRISPRAFAGNYLGRFREHHRLIERRLEAAALIATDAAAQTAKTRIRAAFGGARMGGLRNVVDATSDMQRGGQVRRRGSGFSASGVVFLRSRSERTLGAIEAYTLGAEIRPRGRWLWIATDEIPRVTNRQRMTPDLYRSNGFEQKIGPLVQVRSVNGNPLLIVRNVGVSEAGMKRKARSLKKNGRPRVGQREKQFLVAFIGIPRTSRAARVDVRAILRGVQAEMPHLFQQAIQRTIR